MQLWYAMFTSSLLPPTPQVYAMKTEPLANLRHSTLSALRHTSCDALQRGSLMPLRLGPRPKRMGVLEVPLGVVSALLDNSTELYVSHPWIPYLRWYTLL